MAKSIPAKLAQLLRQRGFDKSFVTNPGWGGGVTVRCSQCEALVVNGTATHEHGCPNHKRSVESYR